MKQIKTLLLDVWENKVETIKVEDKLEVFYEKLNCRCIDIICLKIGEKTYAIVCDDEALLRDTILASIFDAKRKPMVAGSLLFFNDSNDGELMPLDADDIRTIKSRIKPCFSMTTGEWHPILQLKERDGWG